ncbi:phosphoribosylaminoimidazolecarboxamide formyltransferase / IMP cyclohydrolase [Burkholderiales bacterium]|nr:MAG: bifunctional phosphoribosylaminoimidazolecarboxamide formyltransferase/IMP cyclohydrolase [Burkholderiales bacterium]CAG0988845.1 phosphoribosylaminoimidazolecarboxamide formyltransferase / IMP cyclohydrolase [Burkholderiales bacterium]
MTAPVAQALLSVSDKTGLVEFARGLAALGVRLLSTGGTAKLLAEAGLTVTDVGSYTGFPEMLDGRVKTLHPKVHGGILARRDLPEHLAALDKHGIPTIDLVVVNLYPFREAVARAGCTLENAIENIDIGGPTMVRAAAKNYRHVGVVVDPADYPALLAELQGPERRLSEATRFGLARKAFSHTAAYDGAISNWLTARNEQGEKTADFPERCTLQWAKVQDLRYGENPHQQAAFYRDELPLPGGIASYRQHQGKELSYNNIADADAAWECVKTFHTPACVIIKHANPCGVAVDATLSGAYRKAFATDPTSAFGGIIAFNQAVDRATAETVSGQFMEVLIAPGYSAEALEHLAQKANVRVLQVPLARLANAQDLKRVGGGLLIQTADQRNVSSDELKVVTRLAPSAGQIADLMFVWRVAKFVKSNAIVFAKDGQTVGVGAGQMSRVDSARIASIKAQNAGLILAGSVAASDAFFPFRDGLDVVIDAGATAVIQPGGSLRDEEVIAAANERGIAMVFTGVRHFRH